MYKKMCTPKSQMHMCLLNIQFQNLCSILKTARTMLCVWSHHISAYPHHLNGNRYQPIKTSWQILIVLMHFISCECFMNGSLFWINDTSRLLKTSRSVTFRILWSKNRGMLRMWYLSPVLVSPRGILSVKPVQVNYSFLSASSLLERCPTQSLTHTGV